MKNFSPSMMISIDTREQRPFLFLGYPCETRRATLHTADYSIAGHENEVCIERKEIDDIVACCMGERERFKSELERMSTFQAAAIVVESPLAAIRRGKYHSKINPVSVEQSLLSFSFKYRIPIYFGQNRLHAENIAFNALRHYYNHTVDPKFKIGYVSLVPSTGKHFIAVQ